MANDHSPLQYDMDDLHRRIEERLEQGRLNAWQRNFFSNIHGRIDLDGQGTRLSARQIAKLSELLGPLKMRPASPWARVPPSSRRWERSRHQSWGASRFPRYLSRYAIRQLAPYVFVLLLFLGIGIVDRVNFFDAGSPSLVGLSSHSGPGRVSLRASQINVVDGDTIRVSGDDQRVRLVGFDTPEIFSPACAREAELGRQASDRLQALISSGETELQRVACACPPGTEGTQRCNLGRSCAVLRVNGRDVGSALIAEGLAVPFNCGATRCPRQPHSWC